MLRIKTWQSRRPVRFISLEEDAEWRPGRSSNAKLLNVDFGEIPKGAPKIGNQPGFPGVIDAVSDKLRSHGFSGEAGRGERLYICLGFEAFPNSFLPDRKRL